MSDTSVQLINNPNDPSTKLIQDLMNIHKQGQANAVGDSMVAQSGGRRKKVNTYKVKGRGRKIDVYAEDSDKAAIVGFMLLVKPATETFIYTVNSKRWKGYRKKAVGKNKKGKYYNYVEPL